MASRSTRARRAAPRRPVGASTGGDSRRTGQDTNAYEPFWKRWSKQGDVSQTATGLLVAAMDMIPPLELYAASFTPKGAFLTRVVPANAFRMEWQYVPEKRSKVPLDDTLRQKIIRAKRKYNLKQVVIEAVSTAEIFGRSLVYMHDMAPPGMVPDIQLRVTRLDEQYVHYDEETGNPVLFRPMVRKGKGQVALELKPSDCILFLATPDPNGNGFQGIPALLPAYHSIVRMENISEAYADLITMRGLGLVDVTVSGADTEEDLQTWVEKFKDPSSYRATVHNEQIEVETKEGIRAAFSLDETLGRYTKEVSSASGAPAMRMEGVQTGTVTGSETDQDNMAELYTMLQERYEPAILRLFKFVDPSLDITKFELEFPMDLKLDRMKQTQIFSTEAGSVMAVPDLLTVDEARDRLGYPSMEGGKGKMTIAELMESLSRDEETPESPEAPKPPAEKVNETADNNRDWKSRYQNERFYTDSKDTFEDLDFNNISTDNIESFVNACLAVDSDRLPIGMARDDVILEGLRSFSLDERDKDRIASIIVREMDSMHKTLSYTEINNILNGLFGSGKSPNWISKKRGR